FADAAGKGLDLQLTANRQIRRPAKKVRGKIAFPVLARQLVEVERGHLEHLAGALAIAAGDDGRVNVKEALLLEEIVDRVAYTITQAGDGAKGIRSRPQMSDGAEELKGMAFFLERIGLGIGVAVDSHRFRVQFRGLPLGRRFFDFTRD